MADDVLTYALTVHCLTDHLRVCATKRSTEFSEMSETELRDKPVFYKPNGIEWIVEQFIAILKSNHPTTSVVLGSLEDCK